jgi:hypothetical protein
MQHHSGLRNCGDHALDAYELATSLLAGEQFWAAYRRAHCCATVDECPRPAG